MSLPRKPQKFIISDRCTGQCSLNPRNCPIHEQVHGWIEAGDNNPTIQRKASAMGVKISNGALGRHFASHLLKAHEIALGGDRGRSPA